MAETFNNTQSFWHAINILLKKPHVLNKRLWGCKIWKRNYCKPSNISNWTLPDEFKRLQCILTKDNLENITKSILQEGFFEFESNGDHENILELIITELLPKSVDSTQVIQVIVINKRDLAVTFYDITQEKFSQNLSPKFTYTLKLVENRVVLNAKSVVKSKPYMWLQNTLVPQIRKWTEEATNSPHIQQFCVDSLSLVCQDKYYVKYHELKLKYGKDMVKVWPECTDPSKFVYEDVAIATYLLLLWEDDKDDSKKKSFVDLGCGNGLLVYILTKEGHRGIGIDVRRRNIWDMYDSDVKLEDKTIVPSDTTLFPQTDWIIGNHSDELTPWIPVIAAKSSFHCNFFLLPCCAYNFDGTKYQRKDSSKSQYVDYLAHIKDLCADCGFNVKMDRLKIPSTKRICLVGNGRIHSEEKYNVQCNIIQEIIERNSCVAGNNSTEWVPDFKPREAIERVRNCTQIDKNLIHSIVDCIAKYLLEDTGMANSWNGGKTVDLNELIKLIPQEQLKHLKSECGGIQTLLKNNHNIFKVQSGTVQLRYPKSIDMVNRKNITRKINIQQKPCWFYNNHPQGCPLTDTKCSFLHVKS